MTESKNKIMIIDDNIIDQMITKRILNTSYSNSDVLVMDGPLQALNYLETNEKDTDSLPNLIILDLDMPVMNGFGFLKRFSKYTDKLKNSIKIVVLTGTETIEDIELLKANPAVSKVVFKPLFQNSLTEILKPIL